MNVICKMCGRVAPDAKDPQHAQSVSVDGPCHRPDCGGYAEARKALIQNLGLDAASAQDSVNHPKHYGGDVPYEAIKVIEAWKLDFTLGNAVKYIARAPYKNNQLEDLKKARWYLDHRIKQLEHQQSVCNVCGGTPVVASGKCSEHYIIGDTR